MIFFIQLRELLKTIKYMLQAEEAKPLLIISSFLLTIGTLFYHVVEKFSWIDAIYFSFITLTTIGYGDLHPTTNIGKLFTIVYALLGIGIIGLFIATVANNYIVIKSKEKES